MLESGVLNRARQLALEIHVGNYTGDTGLIRGYYDILHGLEEIGMRRWYHAVNYYGIRRLKKRFRSCCYEMVYINQRFLLDAP